jgi:hypothetical protein
MKFIKDAADAAANIESIFVLQGRMDNNKNRTFTIEASRAAQEKFFSVSGREVVEALLRYDERCLAAFLPAGHVALLKAYIRDSSLVCLASCPFQSNRGYVIAHVGRVGPRPEQEWKISLTAAEL